jgi:hypothetical protein
LNTDRKKATLSEVRIREPLMEEADGHPQRLKFVAFTSAECLNCSLGFTYGPGFKDEIICYLHLPVDVTSVEVFDLFNNMLKPKATEMSGISTRNLKGSQHVLSCNWKLKKHNFKLFADEAGKRFGKEWQEALYRFHAMIGTENINFG